MQLMELTRQGYAVEFYEENSPCTNGQAKESVTYVTSNAGDAAHWSMQQAKEGNKVSITYDEVNHVYIYLHINVAQQHQQSHCSSGRLLFPRLILS